jgi:argonaute-like protein implicated in RNA metabolism and viral defense
VICPQVVEREGRRLQRALIDGVGRVVGFERRFQLKSFRAELRPFADDDVTGYRTAASEASRADAAGRTVDIVYVVTRRADKGALHGSNRYLAAKAVLANAGVASQAVTVETLQQPESGFQWTLDQIVLQCYAKLGNIAYALHDPDGKRELVLGVGRSDVQRSAEGGREQLFGAAVAFRQDGDFLFAGSTPVVTADEYEKRLTKLIRDFVDRFTSSEGRPPERIVIHLFKRTGRQEVRAVQAALADTSIEWALLHVNRDTPLWLVEVDGQAVAAAPVGTVVRLSAGDHLLMTGTDRIGKARNPHPLRLTLDRNSTFTDMDRLTWQVFAFTAVTMRSYFKTHEPSSILYGRLLAEKVGLLEAYGFQPERAITIGDKPWFL